METASSAGLPGRNCPDLSSIDRRERTLVHRPLAALATRAFEGARIAKKYWFNKPGAERALPKTRVDLSD